MSGRRDEHRASEHVPFWPWCCRHKALLWYVAAVSTATLTSTVLEVRGVW